MKLLALVIVTVLSCSCQVNSDPVTIFGVLIPQSLQNFWNIAEFVHALGGKVKDSFDVHATATDDTSARIDAIMNQVGKISDQIGGFESRLNLRLDGMVNTLVGRITYTQQMDSRTLQLNDNLRKVDEMWLDYLNYSKNLSNFHNTTLKNFVAKATSDSVGLKEYLLNIHQLFFPVGASETKSLYETMLSLDRETTLISCDEGRSLPQRLYRIHEIVALTELRGSIMSASAYGLQSMFEGGKFYGELESIEERFITRTKDYISAVKAAMRLSSNWIRRCDPASGHKEDHTCVEMKRVFQTYLVNEADIDPKDSCLFDCKLQPATSQRRRLDDWFAYAHQPECEGTITDCHLIAKKLDVCVDKNGPRRYRWFKGSNSDEGVYGNDQTGCDGDDVHALQLKSWSRFAIVCEYCACTCEANRTGSAMPALINFLPSVADFKNNMVVVGVKIYQEDNIIHVQIREGKLEPRGGILKGSERWVPIKRLNLLRRDVYSHDGKILAQGKDYDSIHREGKRINLDDVSAPKDHVVIGVRFKHEHDAQNQVDNPIRLEVLTVPFDYDTGKLSLKEATQWRHGEPIRQREKISFNAPNDPRNNTLNVPTKKPNLYVEVQQTDMKKDAGQTVIPFWDIQPVVTSPSFPLGGVSIFYKGDEKGEFGGYLALRIASYNFVDHISQEVPKNLQGKYGKVLSKLVSS